MSLTRRVLNPHASGHDGLAHPKVFREKRPVVTLRRRQRQAEVNPATAHHRRQSARQAGLMALKKTEAKVRDYFRCQFPGCPVQGREFVEAAHCDDAGMGGRPSVSSERKHFVTLCNHLAPNGGHHRGNESLHSTHIEVRPRDPELGADGILDWYRRTRTGNTWSDRRHVGTTGYPRLQDGRS